MMKQLMGYGDELEASARRHYKTNNSQKPRIYFHEYERLFGHLKDKPIRLLELGVQDGYSMLVWRDYFKNATIVGLDQSPKPSGFPNDPNFHFVQGDQQDPKVLDEAVRLAGGAFDIVIDDASHRGGLTAQTFSYIFPNHLKPGGFYAIEDICTAFSGCGWFDSAPYEPAVIGLPGEPKVFPSHQHGCVGLVKQLIDHSMCPCATKSGKWSTPFPVFRTTVVVNLAIFEKLDE